MSDNQKVAEGSDTDQIDPYRAAKAYHARGMVPIPVPARNKNPGAGGTKGWQKRRHEQPPTEAEYEQRAIVTAGRRVAANVGVLTGVVSGRLVDIDLDAILAVRLAPQFLPSTAARFGRIGKPESHWLYIVDGYGPIKTAKFVDPTDKKVMLLEYRGDASQTIFPPSIHPSGEHVEWVGGVMGEPAKVSVDELMRRVRALAAATLLARHWPAKDSHMRHEVSLPLAGGLVRAGWKLP
jgi:hypothetical protein